MTIWNQIKNGFNKAVYGELTKEDYWEYYKRENPLPKVDAIELLNDLNELLEYRRQATVNAMESDIIESDEVIEKDYSLDNDFVKGIELL
jgi:hypothetical protein